MMQDEEADKDVNFFCYIILIIIMVLILLLFHNQIYDFLIWTIN